MSLVDNSEEPLVLADGTKIDPSSGKVIKQRRATASFLEVPSNSEAQKLVVRARRSVGELPLPPTQLTGVALVAFYTLYGLGDNDIAIALEGKVTVEQIKRVRELDAYKEFMENAKSNILETAKDKVRDLFEKHAQTAAEKIIDLAETAESEVLAFKASQDILDRAGHRPADIVQHKITMEDALNIVITRRDETQPTPLINITPDKVTFDDSILS